MCWNYFVNAPYPILDTRISVFRSSSVLRNAQTIPPEIWNGVGWGALVKDKSKCLKKNDFFFPIFPDFFSGLGWTRELWVNRVFIILRNKEDFFFADLKKKNYIYYIFWNKNKNDCWDFLRFFIFIFWELDFFFIFF